MKNILAYAGFCRNGDWTPALHEALSQAGTGVLFPGGEYHFYAMSGIRRYCFFSNNDEGVKSVIFHLEDRHDFHLAGENARLIFHGRCVPFLISCCSGIRLSGFSIDFADPFIPQAEILECGKGSTVLRFPPEQSFQVIRGRICFLPDEYSFLSRKIPYLVYDTERGEPAPGVRPGVFGTAAEILDSATVRIQNLFHAPEKPGTLVLKPEPRLCPGIVIDESSDITLTGMTLHHAGGMGILGQNSRNLFLQDVRIGVRPGSGRLISVSDDAAHFAQCSGTLHLERCCFENQWDDGLNVHGIYRKFRRRGDLMLEAGHFQQFGIPIARPGERLEIGGIQAEVKTIAELNKQYSVFSADRSLAGVPDGVAVMNLDRQPDVTVRECRFSGNKPRGLLVTSMGKIVIENNYFHTPGAAVYLAGDAGFWFESGPIRNMSIRNNIFDDCLYHGFCTGRAVIDICPSAALPDGTAYHRGIKIENNLFLDAHHKMIAASNCAELTIAGNRWRESRRYPQEQGAMLCCSNCPALSSDIPVSAEVISFLWAAVARVRGWGRK